MGTVHGPEPVIVPSVAVVQVPAVTLVLVEVGAVHPAGTVIVASEPDANGLLGPVKLKVRVSPVLLAARLVGETVIVPDPLLAAVTKLAVIVVALPVPLGVTNVQGFEVAPVTQVVPVDPAVPVTVQLLKANPEFAVAVMVTLVPTVMLLDVQVVGQLMPPVLLVTVPSPVGDMTAVMVSLAHAVPAARNIAPRTIIATRSARLIASPPPGRWPRAATRRWRPRPVSNSLLELFQPLAAFSSPSLRRKPSSALASL